MENKIDFLSFIKNIDPSVLSYEEWVQVGMGLKAEGYTADVWDEWSSTDAARYKKGEVYKKWISFQESGVTGGTIVDIAKRYGWKPKLYDESQGHALDWDDEIKDELVVVQKGWVEGKEITPKFEVFNPIQQIKTYIETLFHEDEVVGVVTNVIEYTDEKTGEIAYSPSKGVFTKTSKQILEELDHYKELGSVFGDYKEEMGAWIRFNPLNGKGIKNENVTDYRYALVESDSISLEKQNALLRELELPIAILVHSGKKSLHAIVKVDASTYEEYRKRVDFLYTVCKKNGLEVDQQNKNPSRLSRLPGVTRNGRQQFIVDTHIGKTNWNEWKEYIESVNDELPDPETLSDIFENLPPLAPVLIDGVLRQGHKMLLSGPSKAGKSFALIELCINIAEGGKWLGWDCTQGKVLYVNLELDRASCLHRFKDVYTAMKINPTNISNIDVWNLRGNSTPLDTLAPKLIRRALKKGYIAIVIDPIYKVITGDENSASEMAKFTNQFDKIATELKTAVIYCHHHSKGSQGSKKAMDRASGSGVFARDPDAILDLIELEITDDLRAEMRNEAQAMLYLEWLKYCNMSYYKEHITTDDTKSAKRMYEHVEKACTKEQQEQMQPYCFAAEKEVEDRSAWRVDGILREFPKPHTKNIYFNYPVHLPDTTGKLKDLVPEGDKAPWEKAMERRKPKEVKKKERNFEIETAYAALEMDGEDIYLTDLMEAMNCTKRTVWNRIKEHGGFKSISEGPGKPSRIVRKDELVEVDPSEGQMIFTEDYKYD